MATLFGMALGGWMSGVIFDLTGSYQRRFINGIVWNLLNIAIAVTAAASGQVGGASVAAPIRPPVRLFFLLSHCRFSRLEADLAMGAVTEGLGHRRPAAAQGDPRPPGLSCRPCCR